MTRLVDKYRPKTFKEVIGQKQVVAEIENYIKKGDIPHLLFKGPPGTGKTTLGELIARALFNDQWRNKLISQNASDERGIAIVRGKIKRLSKIAGRRIIFLDEADAMTPEAQDALRRIMEESGDTIFILSCNDDWKIKPAIKSRCTIHNFSPLSDSQVLLAVVKVLIGEGIHKEEIKTKMEQLKFFATINRGDLRTTINNLERIITPEKTINTASIYQLIKVKEAANALMVALNGDFDHARELIEDAYINNAFDVNLIVNEFFEKISSFEPKWREYQARLFVKLSDLESNTRRGGHPLIHVISFISYAWIMPHLLRCPALTAEGGSEKWINTP